MISLKLFVKTWQHIFPADKRIELELDFAKKKAKGIRGLAFSSLGELVDASSIFYDRESRVAEL